MMTPLGRYIIRARERRGWTRAELARVSGVPYTTLRNIEAAKRSARSVQTSEVNLDLLANALGEGDREIKDMFEQMRILAGYMLVISKDAQEQDLRLLANIDAHPKLRRALEELFQRGDNEALDRAFTALEVARRLEGPQ